MKVLVSITTAVMDHKNEKVVLLTTEYSKEDGDNPRFYSESACDAVAIAAVKHTRTLEDALTGKEKE